MDTWGAWSRAPEPCRVDNDPKREALKNRLRHGRFPWKRDCYDIEPQLLFDRLKTTPLEKLVALSTDAEQSPDSRYTFGGRPLLIMEILVEHFDMDPLPDFFTEEARMAACVRGHPSPLALWLQCSRQAWSFPKTKLLLDTAWDLWQGVMHQERNVLALRDPVSFYLREAVYKIAKECTQFKVSQARALLEILAKDFLGLAGSLELRVLDPCGGWGDRLLGALATEVSLYVAVDPNAALHAGYRAMCHQFQGSQTSVTLLPHPFEDCSMAELRAPLRTHEGYDLVFTSPPFSSFELYVLNDTDRLQSSRRHPHRWAELWLFPAVRRMCRLLRPGGVLALYIMDTYVESYCRRLLTELESLIPPEEDGADSHIQMRYLGIIWCTRRDRARPLWLWRRV
jgi:hypothetical protein